MSIEQRKAANDNFTEGELRQQRRGDLEMCSATIREVKDWIKHTRETALNDPETSQSMGVRRQEIEAALEALETALTETDTAVGDAEREPDTLELFGIAKASAYRLSIALAETERVIDEE